MNYLLANTQEYVYLNLLVIFNPNAASGRSIKKLASIKEKFKFHGVQTVFKLTTHPGHGIELVRATTDLTSFDGVIAAGGDGTVFEVLNGLYQQPKQSRVPLGLLPIGTGNAFARDLGLQPSDWSGAIDLLSRGHTRLVDVGYVKSIDDEFYFLNIIGMGFSVDAGQTAQKLKVIGNSAYTLATLWQTLKLKSYPLILELDGRKIKNDNVFVTISNTRYTGTHFLIAPDAVLDDGLLDVTILESLPRHRLLKLFPSIYTGKHVKHPEVSTYKATRISIQSPQGMPLGPDGEFRGKTPVEITCLHKDLSVFM